MIHHLYSFLIKLNSFLYDKNIRKVNRLGVPVVSIGNISAGGSGKTPFTQTVVNKLLKLKQHPAIVSRGFKRKSKGEIIVSDGSKILSNIQDSGDELYLHAIKINITVIANSNRFKGSQSAINKYYASLIVLDDGFQHRKLFRKLDIVLIDEFTISQKYLLPKGRLREQFSALNRADVICIEEGIDILRLQYTIQPNQLVITTKIKIGTPYLLNQLLKKNQLEVPVNIVISKNIIALSAIAHPSKFENTLSKINVVPVHHISYSDHYFYTLTDIQAIVNKCSKYSANSIITTEKDAVKLFEFLELFESKNIKVFVLPIEMIIIKNEELFDNLLLNMITTKDIQK